MEGTLSPKPLFPQPLAIKSIEDHLEETFEKSNKAKRFMKLIHGVRGTMANNIEDKMSLSFEFWELVNKSSTLIGSIFSLRESSTLELLKYLNFNDNCVETFLVRRNY